jgi:hypothetical protein
MLAPPFSPQPPQEGDQGTPTPPQDEGSGDNTRPPGKGTITAKIDTEENSWSIGANYKDGNFSVGVSASGSLRPLKLKDLGINLGFDDGEVKAGIGLKPLSGGITLELSVPLR